MDKVEFITRLEAAKEKLPTGVVPLYMTKHPEENLSRLKNTVSGKVQDEKILENLEALAEILTP